MPSDESPEESTRQHLIEALETRGTQARISEALEVSPATVKRWADGEGIPAAMVKLLRLYFFGEIPFELVHPRQDLSSVLRFTEQEWKMIEILATRKGIEAKDWIRSQVLDYLAFLEARQELEKEANKFGAGLSVVPSPREEPAATPRIAAAKHWLDLRGGIAAGLPIDAVVEEPVEVPKEYGTDHYALRVFGASMEPKVPDGSLIVVQEWREKGFPKQGKIVVYSDANGSTLKQLGYRKARAGEEANSMGKVAVLKSLNPAYPDVEPTESGRIDAVFVEVLQ